MTLLVGHPARDPRVRAHQHGRGQRLRRPGGRALPRARSSRAGRGRHRRRRCTIMQSNGGVDDAEAAMRRPAHMIESGPAAGVIACAHLARATGERQRDLARHGRHDRQGGDDRGRRAGADDASTRSAPASTSRASWSRAAATRSSCRSSTSPRSAPAAAASSRSTRSGSLSVGPEQRGRGPGPGLLRARRRRADAHGRAASCSATSIREASAGGAVTLDAGAARGRRSSRVADAARAAAVDEAAYGVFTLAVATMTRAVKAVTTYRGRDPRDFVLCWLRRQRPGRGVEIARALEIRAVLVPPAPGVFSAVGLLFSDVEHEFVRTLLLRGDAISRRGARARLRRARGRGAGARSADDGARATVVRRAVRRPALRRPGLRADGAGAGGARRRRRGSSPTSTRSTHRTYGHGSEADPVDVSTCADALGRGTAAQRVRPARGASWPAARGALAARPTSARGRASSTRR